MKIHPLNQLIYFQKQFITKGHALKQKEDLPYNIYKIDKQEDADYFKKLESNENWQNANYVEDIDYELKTRERNDIYVAEDENNDCIGYIVIYDFEYGHVKSKYVLPIGQEIQLDADNSTIKIQG